MKFTDMELWAYHRGLWAWLAKHPGECKEHWPGWAGLLKDNRLNRTTMMRRNYCFACMKAEGDCSECPIVELAGDCGEDYSLWDIFTDFESEDEVTPFTWATICTGMKEAWVRPDIPQAYKEAERPSILRRIGNFLKSIRGGWR